MRTRVPVIMSTGMSSVAEVDASVALVEAHDLPLVVLQCTSAYPCPPEKVGLNMISAFRERYGCGAGLSDHSGTIYPGLAAATLGADVLEIHVTLSREMFGPDVVASVTTSELRSLVEGVRFVDTMLANPVDKDALGAEAMPMRRLFTKSIVARTDLAAGTLLAREHLALKKPGTGLPPSRIGDLVGARLARDLRADEPVRESDLEGVSRA
jgi:N-acetylneuraminate synthase